MQGYTKQTFKYIKRSPFITMSHLRYPMNSKHKGYYGLSGTLEKHLSEVLAEDKGDVHTPPELAEEISIQECSSNLFFFSGNWYGFRCLHEGMVSPSEAPCDPGTRSCHNTKCPRALTKATSSAIAENVNAGSMVIMDIEERLSLLKTHVVTGTITITLFGPPSSCLDSGTLFLNW
ncbi:hypothetical protein Anapl_08344 [Anas platyrhynchos]|uniref:Uncharacterized protein n=1 Tax=Anas platyrhynchos TaxID=8839 RepID=R0KEK5_ANAPL|nr:hypothetical protein Anapl_08344 [Anas platyrhynchos]